MDDYENRKITEEKNIERPQQLNPEIYLMKFGPSFEKETVDRVNALQDNKEEPNNYRIYNFRYTPMYYSDDKDRDCLRGDIDYPIGSDNWFYRRKRFWSILNKNFLDFTHSPQKIPKIRNNFIQGVQDTITDLCSGLMWANKHIHSPMKFSQTRNFIESINENGFGGFYDWRIPTVPELASMYWYIISLSGDTEYKWLYFLKENELWTSDTSPGSSDFSAFITSHYGGEYDYFVSGAFAIDFHVHGGLRIRDYDDECFVLPVRSWQSEELSSKQKETSKISIPEIDYEMVYIEPGTFLMGSEFRKSGRNDDETQHLVQLTKGFYIGTHPVSVRQWKKVMGDIKYLYGDYTEVLINEPEKIDYELGNFDPAPVVFTEALLFLDKLTQKFQKELRKKSFLLPTEAEWEYACRAGTETKYFFGDNDSILSYFAWYKENCNNTNENFLHRVGLLLPNPWGLYDMLGNIPEYTRDSYTKLTNEQQVDPEYVYDLEKEYDSSVVIKGGGWNESSKYCRCATRMEQGTYSWASSDNSFRIILYANPDSSLF